MNFYERLKYVCDEKGRKITAVVVECGGNKGSITSWKNGSVPNYTIIEKLSESLDVSVDFLVGKEDIDIQPKKYFGTLDIMLASKYKYINLSCLDSVSEDDLKRYAEYLNCSTKFMYDRTSTVFEPIKADRTESDIDTDLTIEILDVMGSLPGSDDVRFLQIQISRVVVYNLVRAGIGNEALKEYKSFNTANLKFMLSGNFDYAKAKAYGFTSDELRSAHKKSGLSYQYLFSGVKNNKDSEIIKENKNAQKSISECQQ